MPRIWGIASIPGNPVISGIPVITGVCKSGESLKITHNTYFYIISVSVKHNA